MAGTLVRSFLIGGTQQPLPFFHQALLNVWRIAGIVLACQVPQAMLVLLQVQVGAQAARHKTEPAWTGLGMLHQEHDLNKHGAVHAQCALLADVQQVIQQRLVWEAVEQVDALPAWVVCVPAHLLRAAPKGGRFNGVTQRDQFTL
jgi:hypothetical protein